MPKPLVYLPRVQLVRRDGRDVSILYGREGGGGAKPLVYLPRERDAVSNLRPAHNKTRLQTRKRTGLCPDNFWGVQDADKRTCPSYTLPFSYLGLDAACPISTG
jgi:hypothetical protein